MFPVIVPPPITPLGKIELYLPRTVQEVKLDYLDQWGHCDKCRPMVWKTNKFVPMSRHEWHTILHKLRKLKENKCTF